MPHSFPPRRFSDLEDQRRDEGAALLGVVGRLRPDDAADIALAALRAVLGALHGVGVGDPVSHRAADTGHDADQAADAGAADDQPPVLQVLLDALGPAIAEQPELGNPTAGAQARNSP